MREQIVPTGNPEDINVGEKERIASALAGGLLLSSALSGGSFFKKTLASGYLLYRGITGYCPIYNALGKDRSDIKTHNVNIRSTITVDRPRSEVYAFWRKLENLPKFMEHLKSVRELRDETSEWEAKLPGDMGTVSWKSKIVHDDENERIGWRSLPSSDLANAGNVHFRDASNGGTEVHVVFSYHAPGSKVGEGIGKLLNPVFERMVAGDIRNFKKYLESGDSAVK